MRTITVISSRGRRAFDIVTDVTTWGELAPKVEEEYDLSGLQASENINNTTLIHRDATLPEGDFRLFLRPIDTKGGFTSQDVDNLSSISDIRRLIKQEGQILKNYLNDFASDEGLSSWTNLNKASLLQALYEYAEESPSEPLLVREMPVVKSFTECIDDIYKSLESINFPLMDENNTKETFERLQYIWEEIGGLEHFVNSVTNSTESKKIEEDYKEFEKGFKKYY